MDNAGKQAIRYRLQEEISSKPELFETYLTFLEYLALKKFSRDHIKTQRIAELYVREQRVTLDADFIGLFSKETSLYRGKVYYG